MELLIISDFCSIMPIELHVPESNTRRFLVGSQYYFRLSAEKMRLNRRAQGDNIFNLARIFQIGAGLYAVGRPVQKRNDEDGQIGTIQSLPLERGALFNRFFGEPAHGPPHVAGGASGPIGGCRDESRTDNPDLDLRHVFDRNNRKTDLI